MEAIDMHLHYSTLNGYPAQSPKDLERSQKFFGYKFIPKTDQEMAADLKNAGVRGILSFANLVTDCPLEQAKKYNDYAGQMTREFPDQIIGSWFFANPQRGRNELREMERCLSDLKFVGLEVGGQVTGIPASDKLWWPFYELSIEANVPVLILTGWGASGVGLPGGGGYIQDHDHPRHIDQVAAKFPQMTVVAGRVAWPWQSEMIGILLHKENVWNELHGWIPKYYPQELKWDLARRLQDKFMWGSDYPYIAHQRYFEVFKKEGYRQEILDKILFKNAQRLFASFGKVV